MVLANGDASLVNSKKYANSRPRYIGDVTEKVAAKPDTRFAAKLLYGI